MAVWITGDTHGDWINRLKTDSFPEQKKWTKMILGLYAGISESGIIPKWKNIT